MPRSAKRWMQRTEQLRPRIDELQRKHGHDPQRLNEELMALYQKEQVNPAAAHPDLAASLLRCAASWDPFEP